MPVVISLLRGINVGGHNLIPMDALRALHESLDLRDCRTFIQSGNVVFRTGAASGRKTGGKLGDRQLDELARRIEAAIERRFGFRPAVILRTASELRRTVARNPFARRRGIDPRKFLVAFLAREPGAEAGSALRALKIAPEEAHLDGRELYLYYPDGVARPKLSWPLIDRTLKVPLTGRNWNTVTKLLEIAELLEPAS